MEINLFTNLNYYSKKITWWHVIKTAKNANTPANAWAALASRKRKSLEINVVELCIVPLVKLEFAVLGMPFVSLNEKGEYVEVVKDGKCSACKYLE